MKYYVKKEGLTFTVVVFMGNRIMAKTGILGQDLGQTIESFTSGVGEKIDELPPGIFVKNGIVSWKSSGRKTNTAAA